MIYPSGQTSLLRVQNPGGNEENQLRTIVFGGLGPEQPADEWQLPKEWESFTAF